MGFPWYLKPDWLLHAEMLDAQEALAQSADSSRAADQKQDQQIEALNRRVAELEAQLLALETLLSEKGILPPPPQEEAARRKPRRLPGPDGRRHHLSPVRQAPKRQPGFLLCL